MAQQRIITGIDIGTQKCVTLIAAHDLATDQLRIMGVAAVPSKGMKKSQIIDLEKVLETITQSLDAAERMAGLDVKSAFISISGTHIQSQNSKGVVAVASPDQEVVAEDVDRVIEAAQAISLSSDRQIIHVIPKYFKIDSQDGIKDPIGMTGVRLEAEAHIVSGMNTALKNMHKSIGDLGLAVDGFVFSGIAAGAVVLSETEKELGVAVLDIGAGCSSFSVYVDGSLELCGALPIGARHITQDIALGCRVSIDVAEQIKTDLGDDEFYKANPLPGESKQEFGQRKKKLDELKLKKYPEAQSDEVLSKRTIVENIMLPRMQELFELFARVLKEHDLLGEIPAGIVLTGGGAHTIKIAEVAKHELKLPARIGTPEEISGGIGDIHKPSFATSIGLIAYGKTQETHSSTQGFDVSWLIPNMGSLWQNTGGKLTGRGGAGGSSAKNSSNTVLDFLKSFLP